MTEREYWIISEVGSTGAPIIVYQVSFGANEYKNQKIQTTGFTAQ